MLAQLHKFYLIELNIFMSILLIEYAKNLVSICDERSEKQLSLIFSLVKKKWKLQKHCYQHCLAVESVTIWPETKIGGRAESPCPADHFSNETQSPVDKGQSLPFPKYSNFRISESRNAAKERKYFQREITWELMTK